MIEHLDVLVVGAGLSGIAAGYHLQTRCPGRTYAILESRDAIGGTWDLFRYPGIRSDSDMYTLGYSFRPWVSDRAIADGPSILAYIRDTAREHGIDRRIRFGHRVERAAWSTADARWLVECTDTRTGATVRLTSSFLLMCTGYYDYAEGYSPDLPGRDTFGGRIVHPQQWTDDVDHAGKRIVVIGSGATAVTLVPALAETAAHVTMLQRSPTYIVSRPAVDKVATWLQRALPDHAAHRTTQWKNVLVSMAFYSFCRRFPDRARELIRTGVRAQLPPDYDVDTHFAPRYAPWDQRLCLVPDGDLFRAIRDGRAEVVTDHVEALTPTGLALRSGRRLDADLVVLATGLKLKLLGGMQLTVDGRRFEPSQTMNYKGAMFSDVPNLAVALGYTNASWTLKCELICEFVCRVLDHMERGGHRICVPRRTDPSVTEEPIIDLRSGYVERARAMLPPQGSKPPWKLYQNYVRDLVVMRHQAIEDGALRFEA